MSIDPDHERAERELLQHWDALLSKLFQAVDRTSLDPTEQKVDPSQVRGYRSRVGQDLKAFQEKLSNIMESEKSGQ
jgi:hypothetical protein